MSFIEGLYGDVAVVVLCGMLFVGEAGVPLPISGEFLLIAGGILIGTGALDPWLFVPIAVVAVGAGAFTGYSWARLVGENGLRAVAERLGQGRRLARLTERLGRAGPVRIALFRLTPGFKVYTSLVAGAVGVDRRRFLLGVGPLIVLWVLALTAIGAVVGAPASRFLSELQNVALQGGLLIAVGAGAFLAVRRIPAGGRAPLARLPTRLRVALAVAVDVTLIATVVVGVLRIVGGLLAVSYPWLPVAAVAWWVELLAVVVVIAVFYSLTTRRGLSATAGETLFDTRYLTHGGAGDGRVRLIRLLQAGLDEEAAPPADLVRTTAAFRALADGRRLQVARLLLQRDASASDVASTLSLSARHAEDALGALEDAGVLAGDGEGSDRRYTMASDHVRLGLAELLTHLGSD